MRNNIIFYCIIALFCESFFFSTFTWASDSLKEEDKLEWITLITSDIVKDRFFAQQMILDSREDIIEHLLSIVNSPIRQNEEFYNSNTSRNIAISLLGKFRAKEAVADLTKRLLPKTGQSLFVDELRLFSPAGYSLVEIGLPSVPPLVELLKSEETDLLIEQCVKIIVSIKGISETELLFESLIEKETDDKKSHNLKLVLDFMKDPKINKILVGIEEKKHD